MVLSYFEAALHALQAVLEFRLGYPPDKWRNVYKALTVLEFLLKRGASYLIGANPVCEVPDQGCCVMERQHLLATFACPGIEVLPWRQAGAVPEDSACWVRRWPHLPRVSAS